MDSRGAPGSETAAKPELQPPALYVNFLRISPGESEFFLHFGQLPRGETRTAHLAASLVTSPQHAKVMLRALQEAIARHEARYGALASSAAPSELAPSADARPLHLRS
jgi:hypothetical protein